MERNYVGLLAGLFACFGCVSNQALRTVTNAEATASGFVITPIRGVQTNDEHSSPGEADLSGPLRLEVVEAALMARNPILQEGLYRVRALGFMARAQRRWPAPGMMAELWQVPLSRPYALQDAGMLMVSLRQQISPPGLLENAAQSTAFEAQAAAHESVTRARTLLRDADRAFADYAEATARHEAHVRHLEITEQMLEVARARYATGAFLVDVTKVELERARLLAAVARERGSMEEARAVLNGLLARPAGAALGPPKMGEIMTVRVSLGELIARTASKSADVFRAEAMRDSARHAANAAHAEEGMPVFTVGVNYFHPIGGTPAGWGASAGMSLPWIWGAASGRADAAEQQVHAEDAALEGTRVRVRAEMARALASVHSAEARLVVLHEHVQSAANRALEVARAGYATGGVDLLMGLDALRSSLDVAIEVRMARGDLDRALADLDLAAGERVPRVALFSSKENQHDER